MESLHYSLAAESKNRMDILKSVFGSGQREGYRNGVDFQYYSYQQPVKQDNGTLLRRLASGKLNPAIPLQRRSELLERASEMSRVCCEQPGRQGKRIPVKIPQPPVFQRLDSAGEFCNDYGQELPHAVVAQNDIKMKQFWNMILKSQNIWDVVNLTKSCCSDCVDLSKLNELQVNSFCSNLLPQISEDVQNGKACDDFEIQQLQKAHDQTTLEGLISQDYMTVKSITSDNFKDSEHFCITENVRKNDEINVHHTLAAIDDCICNIPYSPVCSYIQYPLLSRLVDLFDNKMCCDLREAAVIHLSLSSSDPLVTIEMKIFEKVSDECASNQELIISQDDSVLHLENDHVNCKLQHGKWSAIGSVYLRKEIQDSFSNPRSKNINQRFRFRFVVNPRWCCRRNTSGKTDGQGKSVPLDSRKTLVSHVASQIARFHSCKLSKYVSRKRLQETNLKVQNCSLKDAKQHHSEPPSSDKDSYESCNKTVAEDFRSHFRKYMGTVKGDCNKPKNTNYSNHSERSEANRTSFRRAIRCRTISNSSTSSNTSNEDEFPNYISTKVSTCESAIRKTSGTTATACKDGLRYDQPSFSVECSSQVTRRTECSRDNARSRFVCPLSLSDTSSDEADVCKIDASNKARDCFQDFCDGISTSLSLFSSMPLSNRSKPAAGHGHRKKDKSLEDELLQTVCPIKMFCGLFVSTSTTGPSVQCTDIDDAIDGNNSSLTELCHDVSHTDIGDVSMIGSHSKGEKRIQRLVQGIDVSYGGDSPCRASLAAINKSWFLAYKPELDGLSCHLDRKHSHTANCGKKVTFSKAADDLIPVLNGESWADEYTAARRGPWIQYGVDSERFRNRIQQVDKLISHVLRPDHRSQVHRRLEAITS